MEQQRSYGRIEGAGGAGAEAVSSSWGDPDPGDLTGYQLLGRRVKGDGSWELNVSPSFLEDPSRLLSSQVHLREGVGNTAGEVDVRKRLGNARPANHPYHLADHLKYVMSIQLPPGLNLIVLILFDNPSTAHQAVPYHFKQVVDSNNY